MQGSVFIYKPSDEGGYSKVSSTKFKKGRFSSMAGYDSSSFLVGAKGEIHFLEIRKNKLGINSIHKLASKTIVEGKDVLSMV